MKRIESFKSFSEIKTQLREEAKQKEMASKREASTAAFNELLSKYGAASVKDLNEDDMAAFMEELREGNAFSAARAKAIAAGKKEFTVDGETYPVEDVDAEDKENAEEFVEESVEAVNEGTRGQVGIIDKNGNIESIYTHYDSYPENVLPVLKKYYKDAKSVEKIVAKGDSRGIDKPTDMEFYGDNRPNSTGKIGNIDKYIKDIRDNGGAEYLYLYDETDKMWYMANVRSDSRNKDLVPAFESVNLNENYEVIYSDGVSHLNRFRSEAQAIDFMKKEIASNKKLKDIAVYKPGMHSTAQTELVVKFWGDGSYLDNVAKKDKNLAGKKLEESANEEVDVDVNFETVEERNAFIFAAAKAKKEGKKRFTFNGKTFPVTLKVDLLK